MVRALRMLAIVAAVAVAIVAWRDYREGRARLALDASEAPAEISEDVASQSAGWNWSQTSAGRPHVAISANGFRQDRDRSGIELTGVRLEIQHPESGSFDRVVTDAATFDTSQSLFYSEGRVVVTLGLPVGEDLDDESLFTHIVTSGATFNTETGDVSTDRATEYRFNGGKGSSVGARYDSVGGRFTMRSEATVERFPATPGRASMVIRAGQLDYYESKEQIHLAGGCSLNQGPYRIVAESGDVFLNDGTVREIVATTAVGTNLGEARELRFETPFLRAAYSPEGWLERVLGEGRTHLSSKSATSQMSAEGDWVQLRYATSPGDEDSRLTDADLVGSARVVAVESGRRGGQGNRSIESESVHLKMRPNGEEIAFFETMARTQMLIVADRTQPLAKTRLDSDSLRIDYAASNRMEKLAANGEVVLVDTPESSEEPPVRSWSESLEARFDPISEELTELRQGGGTRFEQGLRRGDSDRSLYEPQRERFTLSGTARVEQPSVTITADEINLNEATEQLDAVGNVTAQYVDDDSPAGGRGLFADGEPIFAAAERMTSGEKEGVIVYEGNARLWQKANRVDADRVTIDQIQETLKADGNVRSRLREAASETGATLVRSKHLLYTEANRIAAYRGEVSLSRDALRVRSAELDAHVTEGTDATLDHAEARGTVEVVQVDSGRKGFGDTAIYRPASQEVVLMGTPAHAENPKGEETRGARLTYRIDDEALLVEGDEDPAYSIQRQAQN